MATGHATRAMGPPKAPKLLFVSGSAAPHVRSNCIVFHPLQLKNGISNTDFSDILTIHNDQISYVKHFFDPLHVFFTLFGCLKRGRGILSDFVTILLVD